MLRRPENWKRIAGPLSVLAILLVAFGIRYKGTTFGFPLITHPDEPPIVNSARGIIQSGDPNPHFFNYPSLYIYLQTALYILVYLAGKLAGVYKQFSDIEPTTLYFWGRLLTVLLSTLSIYLVYLAGRLLFDRKAAFFAVLFVAFSQLHIRNAYLITVDSPMAFWVMLSFLMSALLYSRGPKTAYYVLNGICAGLAIGTKYTAIWCALPLIVAHGLNCRSGGSSLADRRILLGLITIPLVFFITTPYAILDVIPFLKGVYREYVHYRTGHPGAEGAGFSYGLYGLALVNTYGSLPLAFSCAGLILLGSSSRARFLLLIGFPLVYFFFVGSYRVYFDRNAVVLVPFLALAGGYAVSRILRLWPAHGQDRTSIALRTGTCLIATGLVLIGVYHQAAAARDEIRINNLPSTRLLAKHWIEENIPKSAYIGKEYYTPPLDSTYRNVDNLGYYGLIRVPLEKYEYLIASSRDYGRFLDHETQYPLEAGKYREIFASRRLIKEFVPDSIRSSGPTIRIYKRADTPPD